MPAGEPPPFQYPQGVERLALIGDLVQPLLVKLIAIDSDGSPQDEAFAAFASYTPPREGEQINFSADSPLASFSGRVMEVIWNVGGGSQTVEVFVLPDVD